jgi:hypothetical protein
VTTIDWIIVGFVGLMGAIGWRQGFVSGVLALAGLAAGAFAGSRIAPELLSGGSASPYAPLVSLIGGVAGGAVLSATLERTGFALRRTLVLPGTRSADGALGAVLSTTIGIGLVWLGGAVVLQTPGAEQLRHDVQRSAILRRLNDVLPPSGPLLNALARVDPFPHVNGPEADVGAPEPAIAHAPGVAQARDSVVRILGTACGLGIVGSGWVAGNGLVVTNAHVVAGEHDTVVEVGGSGPQLGAALLVHDVRQDIAVLRVSGLDAPGLALAEKVPSGTAGAVLGYPQDGPYRVRAARVATTRAVISRDAYGRGPVTRQMTPFRGKVEPGNSGGPLVDREGRVLATVFAQAKGRGPRGGFGVANAVVAEDLARARVATTTVSSGRCAD